MCIQRSPIGRGIFLHGARYLTLIVSDGGDSNEQDFIDWLEPCFRGAFGEISLVEYDLPAMWLAERHTRWKTQKNNAANIFATGLNVGGKKYRWGFGSQSRSLMVFRIPEGAQRFHCRVGLDDSAREPGAGGVSPRSHRVGCLC